MFYKIDEIFVFSIGESVKIFEMCLSSVSLSKIQVFVLFYFILLEIID